MKPFVSVIVPCRNEAAALSHCLDSVLASDYPVERLEVIVADGESEDSTRGLLAYYAALDRRFRWIENPARITPVGLNRAISAAHGEFVLRVDAHSLVSPRYISLAVEFLENHPEAWGAGGMMTTVPDGAGMFADAIRTVLSHRFGVGNSQFRTLISEQNSCTPIQVDTVFNCCWRRQVFHEIGLFHEQLVRSQDIEFSSRIAAADGTLWLVPTAQTTYFAKSRFWAYVRHNWSNGIWSILPAAYLGKLPVRVRHLIPLVFVSSLPISASVGMAFPWFRWMGVAIVGSYVLANLGISFVEAVSRRSPKLLVTLPFAFAGLHVAYGAGSIWGCYRFLVERSNRSDTQAPRPERPQARAATASGGPTGTDQAEPVFTPKAN
ncbi:MAG: glycosyltransferase family 2 protein [Acidobacteriota bacterium]